MPADPIRIDEVLTELSRLQQATDNVPTGFTCIELATALGVCRSSAQHRLGALVHSGIVSFVGQRHSLGISGRRCQTPVYQLTNNRANLTPSCPKTSTTAHK